MPRIVKSCERTNFKPSPNIFSKNAKSVFTLSSLKCNRYSNKVLNGNFLPFTSRHLVYALSM